jgi:hypothetical protein
VTPSSWSLRPGRAGTREPLLVSFDRPLDHALVTRCLEIVDATGLIDGVTEVGDEERCWTFVPATPWRAGPHRVVVDPVLEDVAGNSVHRVFDRDLSNPEDAPHDDGPVELPFTPT